MLRKQNKPILIADSGATKTDWVFINEGKQNSFETIGMHPMFISKNKITEALKNSLLKDSTRQEMEIYFYGAGCGSKQSRKFIRESLQDFFPSSKINVESDLIGAGLALFGNNEGIAIILGTGSNSAWFKNGKIVKSHPSLGFILGDEGSGSYLGKMLVSSFLNLELPAGLALSFKNKYQIGHRDLIEMIYAKEFPNRTLASFCPFISDHKEHPFIDKLIGKGLNDFFVKNILKYENVNHKKISFCGSIAYYFQDKIKELSSKYNLKCDLIIQKPMPGLVEFHLKSEDGSLKSEAGSPQ